MKRLITPFLLLLILIGFNQKTFAQSKGFFKTNREEIIGPDGKPFLIKGTNLGNWLVPEGYMFKFKNTNSPAKIHETLAQLIGPEPAKEFWKKYLNNYVTEADIRYLKKIGVNSIRVPFNYRLFTNEDYLGDNDASRGMELLDRVIKWCKNEGLYVILDMHCAPGGQTGDNIDDSYGYPFLFENQANQQLTVDIWKKIATRYKNEQTVMGYDLLNEPIAHYFNADSLDQLLLPLYKKIVKEIRTVDKNHMIFLGGAQWNTNFKVFNDFFDSNIVYTFHKYGDQPSLGSIKRFIEFRAQHKVPIYIGETGENTDEWISEFRTVLEKNNIGWHFWPYKKMDSPKNIASIVPPQNYNLLIDYAETPKNGFKDIREIKVDKVKIQQVLTDFLEACKFDKCILNKGYITALGLKISS